MSSKENRKDPIWWTDGGGNDEYIHGQKWCAVCKSETLRSPRGGCGNCWDINASRRELYRDTRD